MSEYIITDREFILNGTPVTLECIVCNGVTYAPVRVVAETLDCTVSYEHETKVTTINSKIK